jgi:hypothetical protein
VWTAPQLHIQQVLDQTPRPESNYHNLVFGIKRMLEWMGHMIKTIKQIWLRKQKLVKRWGNYMEELRNILLGQSVSWLRFEPCIPKHVLKALLLELACLLENLGQED